MSTTVTVALTRLRLRLGESTANEWADADLIQYITRAEEALAWLIGKTPGSGRFTYVENETLSASSETMALSGLTKTRVAAILWIEFQPSSASSWVRLSPMGEGDDVFLRNASTASLEHVTPQYRLEDTVIRFLPTSTVDRTLKLTYRYLPTVKTSGSDTLEVPDEYVDWLVLRAALFAFADAGEDDTATNAQYATRTAEIEEMESNRSSQRTGEFVRNVSTRRVFSGL